MRRRAFVAVLLLLLVLLLLAPAALPLSTPLPVSAQGGGPATEQPDSPNWDSELRGFWVDAFHDGIKTPAQVTQLIADAQAANANALFVQVRRRGDSYYNESLEPRAADAALDPLPYDPLAALIAAAHGASPPLQVYAWAVVFPVWMADYSTTDPSGHVYHLHGLGRDWSDTENWLSYQYTGGSLAATYDLDPGHPDAAQYIVDVCLHLVQHYDIDALVLDYVRYLGQDYGYNMVNEARFNAAYGRSGHPDPVDADWMNWRREQVTNVVRRLYLETLAVKPDLVLGAAAIAWDNGPDQSGGWESSSAYRSVFQDWRAWLEEGLIDVAVPMNYDREHDTNQQAWFRNWVEWEKDHQYGRAVIPSPAAYLNYISGSLAQAAAVQAPSGLGHNALGTVFYSYAVTNLDGQPNSVFYAALSQPSGYGTPPWASPVSAPTLPWKASPTVGHLVGWASGPAGPLDRATVQVTGPVNRTLLSDANGFFGAVDLPPGSYAAEVVGADPAYRYLGGTVTAGSVTWLSACRPVQAVYVAGPAEVSLGWPGLFTATVAPADIPVTLTWDNGAVGPTAAYSWTAEGIYTVAVTATSACNALTGQATVAAICYSVQSVTPAGPPSLLVAQQGTYNAVVVPAAASLPRTLAWDNGAAGPTAAYSWPAVGQYTVTVTATNGCSNLVAGSRGVRVLEEWPYGVYLPLVHR